MFIKSPKMRAKLKTRAQNLKQARGWGRGGWVPKVHFLDFWIGKCSLGYLKVGYKIEPSFHF
jgi:hypothetical protein